MADIIVKKLDIDGNGQISLDELMAWFDSAGASLFLRRGAASPYNDDVGLGAFMSIVANTPVTALPGVFQATRLPPCSRHP